jgi:hypothetical protein
MYFVTQENGGMIQMFKKNVGFVLILMLFVFMVSITLTTKIEGCTTAIINGEASVDGAPMLWKNRDTDFLSNKVIYIDETPYDYVALVNARDTSGRWVYVGLNSEGFGIMNSVAYNLPKDKEEMQDLEGNIMADALRTCRTADDFEAYIKKNLGPSLGSWANFGVIDAQGNAVIFELHNNGYQKYDTSEAPEKYMINSNFSRSGKEGKGTGYLRFDRASYLFKQLQGQKVSHQYILREVSRDYGHTLLEYPGLKDLKNISGGKPVWVLTRDTINRSYTSAVAVICGKKPGDKNSLATFWVILGEPVASIAVPVWVESKRMPQALCKGETAPLYKESRRIQKMIRPFTEMDRKEYLEVTRIDNKEKTGYLPLVIKTEREIFKETAAFLETNPGAEELARFQSKMARKALETLRKIK